MLRAWHNESLSALDLVVKALHARNRVIWNNIAPELRPKADDEVHSSCGGPWFTNRGDCRRELLAFLRVQNVKLQVRMRGRSKSEDSSLRRVHAGIISGAMLANTTELDRVATAAIRGITNGKRPGVICPRGCCQPGRLALPRNLRRCTKSALRVYLIGREPVTRISTSLLALC